MSYVVAIPSKGKIKGVPTTSLIKDKTRVYLFVNQEEAQAYKQNNPECTIVPVVFQGMGYLMNTIIEHFPDGQKIIFACDDVTGIWYRGGKTKWSVTKLDVEQTHKIIEYGFSLCEKHDSKIWGFNPTNSGSIMLSNKIMFHSFIVGSFFGFIKTDLRYTPTISRKHDYEFSALHLKHFGKTLRINGLRTGYNSTKSKGQVEAQEKEACDVLKTLYPDILKDNHRRTNELTLHYHKKGEPKWIPMEPLDFVNLSMTAI